MGSGAAVWEGFLLAVSFRECIPKWIKSYLSQSQIVMAPQSCEIEDYFP